MKGLLTMFRTEPRVSGGDGDAPGVVTMGSCCPTRTKRAEEGAVTGIQRKLKSQEGRGHPWQEGAPRLQCVFMDDSCHFRSTPCLHYVQTQPKTLRPVHHTHENKIRKTGSEVKGEGENRCAPNPLFLLSPPPPAFTHAAASLCPSRL